MILIATNSDPKVDDLTVLCALENQVMGAQFRYIIIPVCDQRVTLLPAWLASTKALICTGCPLEGGAFGGIASLAS
jgi:hypothetical protein